AEAMANPSRTRFFELDGLRGIAASWVMLFHYTIGVSYWLRNSPELISKVTPSTVNIEGLLAVDLFFIISGFVIFMTVEQCRTVWDFVVSRFARLYPAFWVAATLTSLVAIAMPSPMQPIGVLKVLANLTMLQAYLGVESIETVYWYLAFEFGFYFLMALM